VAHGDDEMAIACAAKLAEQNPRIAMEQILARLSTASPSTQDRLLKQLLRLDPAQSYYSLRRVLDHADEHLRGTFYERLFSTRDPRARSDVEALLDSENPRLAALGIYGVRQYQLVHLQARADEKLTALLSADAQGALIAALEQIARQPVLQNETDLLHLAQHAEPRVRAMALTILATWPNHGMPELTQILAGRSRDEDLDVRRAAACCYRWLAAPELQRLCFLAIEDTDPVIRDRAACALLACGGVAADELILWLQGCQGSPRAQATVLDVLLRHDPSRAMLERVALCKVQQARNYAQLRLDLENEIDTGLDPVGRELLAIVLTERAQQGVDLALAAISRVEGPGVVSLIRAGLHSGDRRDIASACEALRHLDNHSLARLIADALEDIEHSNVRAGHWRESGATAVRLSALARSGDPWLCAVVERTQSHVAAEAA